MQNSPVFTPGEYADDGSRGHKKPFSDSPHTHTYIDRRTAKARQGHGVGHIRKCHDAELAVRVGDKAV